MCFYVHAPTVTDYTYNDADEVQTSCTGDNGKRQFKWIATGGGRWILNLVGGDVLGYQLTARVQHFTSVKLNAPRVAAARRPFHLTGSVAGVTSGQIALALTSRGQKPVTALVPLGKNGSFAWAPRAPKAGTWRVRATYYGDASHRESRAVAVVNVV